MTPTNDDTATPPGATPSDDDTATPPGAPLSDPDRTDRPVSAESDDLDTAVGGDTEPLAVGLDTEPLVVGADTEPLGVGPEAVPSAVAPDRPWPGVAGDTESRPGGPEAVGPEGSGPQAAASTPPPRRAERRIYMGNGVWAPADDAGVAAASPGALSPAGRAGGPDAPGSRSPQGRVGTPAAPAWAAPRGTAAGTSAVERSTASAWPLRILFSVPIIWGAALAAGAAVYMVGLAVAAGQPDLSRPLLILLGVAALAVALALTLACGALLRRSLRGPLPVGVLAILGAGMVAAVAVAILVSASLPVVAAALLLGYAAAVLVAFRIGGGSARVVGVRPFVVPGGPGASSLDEDTRQWSWERPHAGDGATAFWVLRVIAAIVAVAAAVLVGFVAFSLAAESFIAGQEALGWSETLLSVAWQGSAGSRILHVLTLVLINLGGGALYGILAYAAARSLGGWTGRTYRLWAIVMAALVVAGIAAWLLDGTLPK